ncbi:MAG: hydrolase [Coriobacteriia bacterium]|nr:hydrolase [Coriobacteriia bacterium]
MTSYKPVRDPLNDKLLTPENSILILIDYQPTQVNSINSMEKNTLIRNVVTVAKTAQLYQLPIVLSTVNVTNGKSLDTIPALKKVLGDTPSYDRTSINAWEDKEFYAAVQAAGRKKLIICALWTEACLSFPTLDALHEGYDVHVVTDAVGGTTKHAHETALSRMEQAGAHLTSIPQLLCELQRDWNRTKTSEGFVELLIEANVFPSS